MDDKFFFSEFAKNSRFDNDFSKNIIKLEQWQDLAKKYYLYKKGFYFKDQNKEKIPKIIHQIWIGPKKFPSKYSRWASTWKKLNPTWIYKFWTESNLLELKLKNQKKIDSSKNIGYKTDLIRYEILKNLGDYILIQILNALGQYQMIFLNLILFLALFSQIDHK